MYAKRRMNIQWHKIPSQSVKVQIFPFDSTLCRLTHVKLMKSNNIQTESFSAQSPDFTCKLTSVEFQRKGHSSVRFLHCMNWHHIKKTPWKQMCSVFTSTTAGLRLLKFILPHLAPLSGNGVLRLAAFHILCQKYFCLRPWIAPSVLSIHNYVKVGSQIDFRVRPRNVLSLPCLALWFRGQDAVITRH